jgi:hypothetical protein
MVFAITAYLIVALVLLVIPASRNVFLLPVREVLQGDCPQWKKIACATIAMLTAAMAWPLWVSREERRAAMAEQWRLPRRRL